MSPSPEPASASSSASVWYIPMSTAGPMRSWRMPLNRLPDIPATCSARISAASRSRLMILRLIWHRNPSPFPTRKETIRSCISRPREPTLPRITGSTAEPQGIRVDRLPEICPVMLPRMQGMPADRLPETRPVMLPEIRPIMLPETPVSGPSESPKIPTTTAVMYPSVTPKLFWRIFSGKTSFRRVSGTMFCSVWDATSAGGGSIRTTLNG